MRVVVVGAGVGGLTCAVRLAQAGHRVTVLERADAPGGGVQRDGFALSPPFEALFDGAGAPLWDELELARVEPITRYRFADGSSVELSAELARSFEALEAWSPGAGADWARFTGRLPPSFAQPRLPSPFAQPRDLVRLRPWRTVRGLARAHARDPRLRLIIERCATRAGADPRRAPATLALGGHAEWMGVWQPRGGMHELVLALARRLDAVGGELRLDVDVHGLTGWRAGGGARLLVGGGAVRGVDTSAGVVRADAVVAAVDEAVVRRWAGRRPRGERSLSALTLRLGAGLAPATVTFPADPDAELDDLFVRRRPARDPTVSVSADGRLAHVDAPAIGDQWDWAAEGERLIDRLGVRDRLEAFLARSPADFERLTGAPGGALHGPAAHGRLAGLRGPRHRIHGVDGLWLLGAGFVDLEP